MTTLQDTAPVGFLGAVALPHEGSTSSSFENLTDTLVGPSRAFQVLIGLNLLPNFLTLLRGNRLLGSLVQFLNGLGVVAEIHLATHEDDREA